MLRKINGILGFLGVGILSAAYYIQQHLHVEPCPLCLIQRFCFILLVIVFFIAACYRRAATPIRCVEGILIVILSGSGLMTSARQVWLQHLPADSQPDCGASLTYMLSHFPLRETLISIFNGTGDCADIVLRIAGLSLAQWSLFFFALFFLAGIYFISSIIFPKAY